MAAIETNLGSQHPIRPFSWCVQNGVAGRSPDTSTCIFGFRCTLQRSFGLYESTEISTCVQMISNVFLCLSYLIDNTL